MSFFASSSYKPQVRQEGFHLPSPSPTHTNPSPPPSNNNNLGFMSHNFLPDAFRKFPADPPNGATSMDFSDELASLMAHSPSHERSTHSPNPSNATTYDDGYRPPHNIFDISAPSHHPPSSAPNGGPNYPGHFSLPPSHRQHDMPPVSQQGSIHQQHLHDYPQHTHFNSTLPALNSSMRYDPPADHHPPPSSYHEPHYQRHTPSPASRSRSRSRAPSVGPTRNRRKHSVSSTSPPPRPSAIVIPGGRLNGGGPGPASPLSMHSLSNSTSGWFIPSQHAPSSEYSLPTPESITNPFSGPFPGAPGSLASTTNLGVSPSDVSVASPIDGHGENKQALLANEKRRRRRESHNAVERRRRDNINEKISELATLIPECMLDPSATSTTPTETSDTLFSGLLPPPPSADVAKKEDGDGAVGEGGVVKANKGMILRKSVEYIRYLQQLVGAQASRNRELEVQLAAYRGSSSSGSSSATAASASSEPQKSEEPQLVLHTDADADGEAGFMDFNPLHGVGINAVNGFKGLNGHSHTHVHGPGVNGFQGFELASMPEDMEMDGAEEGEGEGARPSTGASVNLSVGEGAGTSPSVSGSGSGEGDEDRDRERDRDRRDEDEDGEERGRSRLRGGDVKEPDAEQETDLAEEEEVKAMET